MSQDELKKKLLSSRKDLLDIGLRNNLINFRPSSKSLRIVDELSAEVLNILYRQNRSMTFLPMPEGRLKQNQARSNEDDKGIESHDDSTSELLHELDGIHWGGEDPADGSVAKRHTDTKLQTALTEDRLFLSLLKIHGEAETYIQEQGVNILFLALGFLHWYEADASDKLRKAPLLMVPVSLERIGAKDSFKLVYTDDDIVQNLSLAAKLKTDFTLTLPQFGSDASADAEDMPPVENFYKQVAESVSNQSRWKVAQDEIHLGFFSFGKFLMFNDLDQEIWPEGKLPSDHPVLSRLLGDGFEDEQPVVAEGTHLDSVIAPGDVKFVRDADSSQTLAILEARGGRNLVIQGPPGTGKSQTITNIIAELLGQGKTVLFVSEKMAALEVVKRRLDECHLGDAVLELHSHKATKQSVLKELGRTLMQGQPVVQDTSEDVETLKAIRDELNQYCDAVNQPIGSSQVPFINALGHYLKLKREHKSLPVWPFAPMEKWTQREQGRFREKVSELARHLKEMGTPSENPFWGCTKTSFSPIEQSQVTELIERGIALNGRISNSSTKIAKLIGLNQPTSLAEIEAVCRAAQRACEAPKLQGIQISSNDWRDRRDSVKAVLSAGQAMTRIRAHHQSMLIDQGWEQDLLDVRQNFAVYGEKWWRGFSGKFRQSRAKLQGLCKSPLPENSQECLRLIDDVLDYQQQKVSFDKHASLGKSLFGSQWLSERSDWDELASTAEWVFKLHDDIENGQLPFEVRSFLSGQPDTSGLKSEIESIRSAVKELEATIERLTSRIQFDQAAPSASLTALALAEIDTRLQHWLANIPRLYLLVRFNQLKEEMVDQGLQDVIDHATQWDRTPDELVAAFDLCWFAGLVEQGYANSPILSKFDNIKQAHLIEKFRQLDKAILAHAQAELAKGIWDRQPGINQPGEMAIIRNELNKKKKLKPIRILMDEAGRAIQQIKPVFMMSPMSIANFLPPGKIEFDVVIFDEASQVKAVDAFGAILRGKQTIVVGDTRQMPPTDFFGRDVELDEEDNVTSDIESILSMFRARGVPERYLSWHYRSRHESLISVSNVEFYDRRLVVFPSAGTNCYATGLRLRHLPSAIYDRGRTRTNREEAKAVASAIMLHAKTMPSLSLGVVAFSVAQRDLIQVELELMRRNNQDAEPFFNTEHPNEPFFVKNLENVQGDERDVIFISIGYGRNESGRIAKDFGPLNRDGGERRLNVLISRAKLAMEVFCNFVAGDLELDADTSHGVRALKHFLKYAETGELDMPVETGRQADSPFELEVKQSLEERGYKIEPQVGAAGYFIDLAVKDPEQPGRYVLAVECDGATYHSARSARDRDRLRQGVLESLGWRFHRIWSTDWFRSPQRELEKTVAAIEESRKTINDTTIPPPTVEEPKAVIERDDSDYRNSAQEQAHYQKAELPAWYGSITLHEVPPSTLSKLIETVVSVEAPVHETNIIKRLLAAFGLSRAGNRIVDNVISAIHYGHRNGLFHYQAGFVYADSSLSAKVRNRGLLEVTERKIELVPPEEIDAALLDVIRMSFSISQEAAVYAALEMLGFGRATSNISGALNSRIGNLIRAGKIREEDGKLICC